MSRFFRRSGDSSSSSETDEEDDRGDESQHDLPLDIDTYNDEKEPDQSTAAWNAHHSHALLHALLEERCLNEVLASNPNARRDAPGIQAEARARYLRLASRLSSLNLMSPGFESDHHASTRQQYRDGLDMLSRQHSSAQMPGSLRRMLTDNYTDALEYQTSNRNSMVFAARPQSRRADSLEFTTARNSMAFPSRPQSRRADSQEFTTARNSLAFPARPQSRRADSHEYTTARNSLVIAPRPQSRRMNNLLRPQTPLRIREHSAERSDYFDPVEPQTDSMAPFGLTQNDIANMYPPGRYRSDFEELRILGHGGYGIVYHTRNYLDNQAYAVKKIPISAARLRRIQSRGQPELDEILLELRTLARLHHPNIVRYFSAWIEWADATPRQIEYAQEHSTDDVEETGDVTTGADDSRSLQRIMTEDDFSGADGILFEESGAIDTSEGQDGPASTREDCSYGIGALRRRGTRSTAATVSDDDDEVSRQPLPEVSTSIQSIGGGVHFAQSTLAIHLQMSLHPMTLADFLDHSTKSRSNVPPLRHCYHIEPAVSIVLAVLEGLEYLHSEGIVHRDVKPANVFLSPNNKAKSGRTSVDLMNCTDCPGHGAPGTMMLDVCIGDFGLAVVADSKSSTTLETAVGTEIYRPSTKETRSASLDLYALGIVFFELLWKFNTRMERYYIIRDLKEGRYPDGFCERVGKGRGIGAMECIDAMLAYDEQVVSIQELKEKLQPLASSI